jgi:hypothetical protein
MDADAVCEVCGNVNPEDTLLCKQCGNNLRDQRARRVTGGEHVMEAPVLEGERTPFVRIGLVILGILLVVYVATNIGNIEDMMAGAQNAAPELAKAFWTGPDSAEYEAMLTELKGRAITVEQSDLAQQQPIMDENIDGHYVLIGNSALYKHLSVGRAVVKRDKDRILFVALVGRTNIEVRGYATVEGTSRMVARDTAGLVVQDNYFGASGFAQKSAAGGYECYGLSDFQAEENYAIIAYKVP